MAEERLCPACGTEIAYAARACQCGWKSAGLQAPSHTTFEARKRAAEARWNTPRARSNSPVVAEIRRAFESSVAYRNGGLVDRFNAAERIPGSDDE